MEIERRAWSTDMEAPKEPAAQAAANSTLGPLGQFVFKTAIVAGAILLSAWIMLDMLDDFATRRMQQLDTTIRSAFGGRQFWTKLEDELDRLADPRNDLSPEKKQKILSQIKIISTRWRPFLVETRASILGEDDATK
jgi:hypothetical protein